MYPSISWVARVAAEKRAMIKRLRMRSVRVALFFMNIFDVIVNYKLIPSSMEQNMIIFLNGLCDKFVIFNMFFIIDF